MKETAWLRRSLKQLKSKKFLEFFFSKSLFLQTSPKSFEGKDINSCVVTKEKQSEIVSAN